MLEIGTHSNEVLNSFAKEVIKQSRANLTRSGKRNMNTLYQSLGYNINNTDGSPLLQFEAVDYAEFVDRGVSGTEKRYDTPYRFKNKMPPRKDILAWAKSKRLRIRDDKGRFAKGNMNSLAFLIQRSIFKKGIKPSLFFTKPFDKLFAELPAKMEEAIVKDIEENGSTNK